ncbi:MULTISPECIES: hypothetical protein [unclassified Oleiphilus]|uniref:hypothetical protein n=1 Tax=unclassified Oleiphilus TaxID=2631174 RepID=UPI0007C37370|nr:MULTISPECIES: hypothetical protein [unclassified Oleiphilus]KZY41399.1 hypothetical protein A3732_18270 [Oleiphilus sp. HI0050]KZZ36600.1 hypothetical protein A3757_13415 [Oleiphilus sp. HI0117]KZZ57452.1 hypothetical protein A3761_00540 [Oleiphilus sp. HI0123]
MVRTKKVGNKLAVKGIDTGRALFGVVAIPVFFVLYLLTFILMERNQQVGEYIELSLIVVLLLMVVAFILSLHSYRKSAGLIFLFNKSNGIVEAFRHKGLVSKYSLGRNVKLKLQRAQGIVWTIGGGSERLLTYHAVLNGSKGEVWIGASAFTQRGLLKKVKVISDYYNAQHEVSEDILNTYEASVKYKQLRNT